MECRQIVGVLAATVLVVTVSGCTGSPEPNQSGNATPARPTIPNVQTFPLDEYFGPVLGTNLSIEERQQQQDFANQRIQELIAQCMYDAGFEYTPVVQPPTIIQEWREDDIDWVTQWGYRITHMPEDTAPTVVIGGTDPAVSTAEQEAYNYALWGDMQTGPIGGCQGQAINEFQDETSAGLAQADEFAPLFDSYRQIQGEWRTNIAEEEIDWAACMAENGFPGFERRYNPEGNSTTPADLIWSEYAAVVETYGRESSQFTELQSREVEMALTDLNCRVEVDYQSRQDARRIAAEKQFITDHQAELEALRAVPEQRG